MVDNKNRWVYKGSVTTPPCATNVYWNVLSTIYPISKRHLEQFKLQLNRGEEGKLDDYGNWRMIQEEVGQNVIYVESKKR
jgi:carbonic anhydrase